MQQRGSKYDQKIKDEALALIASGVKISNASVRLGIPKSTLSDWVHTQNESDEDGVAARREIRRKQIARCEKIGDKVLRALDRKAEAAAKDTRTINDGLAVLEKAAKDGVIALSEAEVASLRNVVSDYTGVGLRELAGTGVQFVHMAADVGQNVEYVLQFPDAYPGKFRDGVPGTDGPQRLREQGQGAEDLKVDEQQRGQQPREQRGPHDREQFLDA